MSTEVRFIRRNKNGPGEEAVVETELDAVPRVGDWVFFDEDNAAEEVTMVSWFVHLEGCSEIEPYAIVYI